MKHTQGPWKVRENFDIKNDQPVFEIDSESAGIDCVATIWTALDKGDIVTDEFTANAHLIAAAPDLLEALQLLTDCCSGMFPNTVKVAKAAIAKAVPPDPDHQYPRVPNDIPSSVGGGYKQHD